MEKYHCCATCVHFAVIKPEGRAEYHCVRLGYRTQPNYKFNCWDPRDSVKKRMQKEN
jgi:hypothetical protein